MIGDASKIKEITMPKKHWMLFNKLDKIIETLEITNALLYRALGGEESDTLECPNCHQNVKVDQLGYCSNCKADLVSAGLAESPTKARNLKERR